jgi:hypothetical protein
LVSSALFAGCGGGAKPPPAPKLRHADAVKLILLANQVARDAPHDGCAARREIAALHAQATALVAARRVPVSLRTPLLNGVGALVRAAPACTPPPAPVAAKPGKPSKHAKKHKEKG